MSTKTILDKSFCFLTLHPDMTLTSGVVMSPEVRRLTVLLDATGEREIPLPDDGEILLSGEVSTSGSVGTDALEASRMFLRSLTPHLTRNLHIWLPKEFLGPGWVCISGEPTEAAEMIERYLKEEAVDWAQGNTTQTRCGIEFLVRQGEKFRTVECVRYAPIQQWFRDGLSALAQLLLSTPTS